MPNLSRTSNSNLFTNLNDLYSKGKLTTSTTSLTISFKNLLMSSFEWRLYFICKISLVGTWSHLLKLVSIHYSIALVRFLCDFYTAYFELAPPAFLVVYSCKRMLISCAVKIIGLDTYLFTVSFLKKDSCNGFGETLSKVDEGCGGWLADGCEEIGFVQLSVILICPFSFYTGFFSPLTSLSAP